jgi:hypothetical protein
MATVRHLNHFPWCPFESEEALRDFYSLVNDEDWGRSIYHYKNILTDLNGAMAIYWRVKSWKITGSQTISYTTEETGFVTQQIPFEFTFTRGAESEKNLVCQGGEGGYVLPFEEPIATQTFSSPINSVPVTMECSFDFPSVGVFFAVDGPFAGHYSGDDFYTHMRFTFNGAVDSDVIIPSSATLTEGDFPFNFEYTGTLEFLDQSTNWTYFGGELAISGLTIKAHEYWPYDPDDGSGPIYNSSTGEQLRPFPTN